VPVTITEVRSTERFVGTEEQPRQVLHVALERSMRDGPVRVAVTTSDRPSDLRGSGIIGSLPGNEIRGEVTVPPGDSEVRVDVPLDLPDDAGAGDELPVRVVARADSGGEADAYATVVVAEPGWTMVMVSHFHYDPVWWSTQASYTTDWDFVGPDWSTRPAFVDNGFALVEAHLKLAVRDPDYHFVLAELDYLKPYFDTFPEQRAVLRRLLAEGRVELVGGTYNEPNTNLTASETTIRNLVYGIGFQRDILGGDPRSAWQLDVFGHDPQFPGLAAKAGLTGSAWARGPHHQWGPLRQHWDQDRTGDVRVMQFESEFEWISPSGDGVLTHYMPDHYGPGWELQHAPSVEAAGDIAYRLFEVLKPVAATRNTLLPVGGDYCPPNNWVTELHRWWNAHYVWPKFVCGTTRMFLDRVREGLAEQGRRPSPQTRDMNPVYTGKDVSYIDTKQAQRAAETAATDAEKLATFASLLGEGRYPEAALDKVWRQLAFGAHHDAITGSEADQVYIDLLTGWREAYDLARGARDAAATAIVRRVDTTGEGSAIVVLNTLAFDRTELVRAEVDTSHGVRVLDDAGDDVPVVVEAPGVIRFVARDVPSMGWRTYRVADGGSSAGWTDAEGSVTVESDAYRIAADATRGGTLTSVYDRRQDRELLRGPGNELRVYEEYAAHPRFSEGPWHLLPNGRSVSSADGEARVALQESPIGRRFVARGMVDGIEFEQVTTLVEGLDRVDFTTRFLDHAVSDRLVRVRFPVDQPGGLPLSEVASGVVGRGFGLIDADTAEAPWTLDNPANTWFGIGTTLAVDAVDEAGEAVGTRAVAVAEVVVADDADPADARDLVVALARSGVTATTSRASGSRYGDLSVDSNLPDLRFVLADGPNALLDELESRVGSLPEGDLLFVPALKPLTETWVPHADLRDVDALPVVVVRDVAVAVEAVTSGRLSARVAGGRAVEPHRDGTVALLTLGLPGFAVDPEAGLNLSLMRSCTGWPSGVWIDPPRRTTPDGSAFQLQHWTHEFHYALVSSDGDWRDAYLPARGQAFSTPLLAVPTTGSPGDLPATHSLLTVEPEREVLVSTVKAAGNPVASGGHDGADPRHSVTMRLVETTGTARRAMVTVPTTPLQSAARADLLEVPREPLEVEDGVLTVDLDGQQIETVVATLAAASQRKDAVLGPDREEAQPVFSRYWLHNRGPAPMGFLPVSVAVTPTVARCGPGDRFEVSWVCSNQYAGSSVAVASRLSLPDGWSATLPGAPTTLAPSGYARFRSWVEVPSEALPGEYAVAAQVTPDDGHLPGGGAVEVVEDVVTVFVGDSSALREVLGFGLPSAADLSRNPQLGATVDDAARPTGLAVEVGTTSLVVASGAVATVTVTLRNDTSSPVRGEIQVASPWGTWEWIPRPTRGFAVDAGATTEVAIEIAPPADATPGHAWLMAKVMWFGRVQYAETVRVEVRE
jgi:alpha-mannosidase